MGNTETKTTFTISALPVIVIVGIIGTVICSIASSSKTTNYRVLDIGSNASSMVSGDKGLQSGDTVWVKQGNIVEISGNNNVDPLVRPCIIK